MADSFIGEIRIFAGNFAPKFWAFCDGQLLPISNNDALFSLLGTIYGGDGRTTFALPELRGRIPVGNGNGPGLTPKPIGSRYGTENVKLTQIPSHNHQFMGSTDLAQSNFPQGRVLAKTDGANYYEQIDDDEIIGALNPDSIQPMGESQAHENIMPFLCLNFIISLKGIYPSRS